MNGKLSRVNAKRVTSVCCALVLSAMLFVPQFQSFELSNNACLQNELPVTQKVQCLTETKLSWSGWLTGHSRSAQFHFLDLLELLRNSGE